MRIDFEKEAFVNRHLGPDRLQTRQMLQTVRAASLESLTDETIPKDIHLSKPLELPPPLSEQAYLEELQTYAAENKIFKSFIGTGYYDTVTPNVILRNVLENPGWYTSYTPYQAEIAQGRLEALINFQTMVMDLTAMEIANASLLDEATAAAEAMSMFYDLRSGDKEESVRFFVSEKCHPQTIAVLHNRAEPLGIEIVTGDHNDAGSLTSDTFGILLQYPGTDGAVEDYSELIERAHKNGIYVAVAADLLSLTLLKPPGEMGADAVVGTTQRFGVPMGYGGPHAAFFATRESFKRRVPGRIIGVTVDAEENPAYRMALQTREQHIRREKATSNICTSQVLLAVIAGFYAVYHGPAGLKRIASRIHGLARLCADGLGHLGFHLKNSAFFDTLTVEVPESEANTIHRLALSHGINFRYSSDGIGISFDEAKDLDDLQLVLDVFAQAAENELHFNVEKAAESVEDNIPDALIRRSDYLAHPVFNTYHSEHEMLRYLKMLENRDLDLTHSMIALGSCTMKLNATTEMIPVTWPGFSRIHPFVPADQAVGYRKLFSDLENWLAEITGFTAVSLQPNSGAQGEYTGLMMIREYHKSRGEAHRNVCIVPSSAHGTNPASAVMAGMKVVVTRCDENGNIDPDDLLQKAEEYRDRLSALMVTYPSTHGVFEDGIREICGMIHEFGGLVYLDGANMNAQVGLTSPGQIGADVCHLNLHKTFCIPHGGGGPGMGPVAVNDKLKPFLPGHPILRISETDGIRAVSAAPWGSAGILSISHAYIRMLGAEGLTRASRTAILNANYLKERLKEHYPVLYTGRNNRCAHEFIIDLNGFKSSCGIDAVDVAKRLIDYGFHAPTMSFPVPGTLMIEPTESESQEELDRFCEAMIRIREEIREIENGQADRENNLLKHAPHTQRVLLSDEWDRPYSRERAAFPADWLRFNKYWPHVSRVNDAYGDRNLVCSCIPIESYADGQEPAVVS